MMSKPLFKSLTKPLFGSLTASVKQAVQRYVTTLSPAGGMYYELAPISLTDFEIEIEFVTTQTGNRLLLCDDHLTTYYINSYSNILSFWSKGTEHATPVTGKTINDGKLHTAVYKLAGTQLKVFLDGVQYGTHTINPYLGVIKFKAGNRTALTSTFDGSYFDIKIWNGGDRHTGQLVRDYRFDDNDGVLVDYSKPLGTEMYDFAKFAKAHANSILKEIHNNGFEFDGTASPSGEDSERCFINITTQAGKQYILTFNQLSSASGVVLSRDGFNGSGTVIASASFDAKYIVFTAASSTTTILFDGHINVKVYSFNNISIKKADGYGKAVNVTAADRELMTFDDHRNAWLGGELINDGGFDNGMSSWLQTQSSASVIGGRLINDGTNTVTNFVYQALPNSLLNQKVLVGINLYDYQDLGNFAVSLSDGGATNPLDETVEHHSFLGTITKNTRVYLNFSSSIVMSVDNISVRRAIEVSQ